jgi:hypothetical protein
LRQNSPAFSDKKIEAVGIAGIGGRNIIGYGIYVGGMGCAFLFPCPVEARMDKLDG